MNEQDSGAGEGSAPLRPADQYSNAYEDEISLVDLWLVLMRRKRVAAIVAFLVIAAGFLFWLTRSRMERYVTSIEIGEVLASGSGIQNIEAREAVHTRLKNTILPLIRNKVADKFDLTMGALPKVEIRVPEEEGTGDFVFLESKGTKEKKEIIKALHQGITERLSEVHSKKYDIFEKRFSVELRRKEIDLQELKDKDKFSLVEHKSKTKLAEAKEALEEKKETFPIEQQKLKNKLESRKDELEASKDAFEVKKQSLEHKIRGAEDRAEMLAEQRKRLKGRMQRVSVERELLSSQVDDIKDWLSDSRKSQKSLYGSVGEDTNLALAALMLGNQAENARKELADVQHRLSIELPERSSKIEAQLEENSLKITETKEKVDELKAELEKLKKDHARSLSEKKRNIDELEDRIEKRASDHQRDVAAAERKIERLKIELKALYSDHKRKIERKEGEIDIFETSGEQMEPTQAPAVVVSAETIGRGGVMIMGLSLVLGLMLGVFGAFFAEFTATAKRIAREREEEC